METVLVGRGDQFVDIRFGELLRGQGIVGFCRRVALAVTDPVDIQRRAFVGSHPRNIYLKADIVFAGDILKVLELVVHPEVVRPQDYRCGAASDNPEVGVQLEQHT